MNFTDEQIESMEKFIEEWIAELKADRLTYKMPDGSIECNMSRDECFSHTTCWQCDMFSKILNRLYEYEMLGTVEELKKLKEAAL